ncbi:MAG: 50S ribosomal protein L15 [Chloroflexi bacterium]|nr:50S ribosomal protein L15 [Chloroflexota bacterium]
MDQHNLSQTEGAKRPSKRVGRGNASGHGTYATRGRKGQNARGGVRPGFEGGQISVVRRAPKLRGFKNPFRTEFRAVNVDVLAERFTAGAVIDGESLHAAGLLGRADEPYKVLGRGELPFALTVKAPRISASAKEVISASGGTFEEFAPADRTPRDRKHRREQAKG